MAIFFSKHRSEERKLLGFLRMLDRDLHIRVRKLHRSERTEVLRFAIISSLKDKHLELERDFRHKKSNLHTSHSGIDYIEHQISLLPSKIKLFSVEFSREDFKKLRNLMMRIERDLNNV